MDYQNKIIAYVDILGFKNYIETTVENGKKDSLYRTLFSFKSSEQSNLLKYPTREASHFSDLLVITIDYNKTYLEQLIEDLLNLTNNVIKSSSLLLRGIILEGKILHYNGIIFGPGLIEAYELEKNVVQFPRIVVNKTLIDELEIDKSKLFLDIDNSYYIDYIKNKVSSSENSNNNFSEPLSSMVQQGLKSSDPGIREKYKWLANRHNQITDEYCSMMRSLFQNKTDFIAKYAIDNLEKMLSKKIK